MASNGPNGYVANSASIAGAKSGIQFGYDSPAMAHSTPQTGHSAPIPIPGGNQRVPSPAHSPSPIPQPSASGGRPPAGLQQPGGQMTFGSLTSEGDRHMRQGSIPQNPSGLGSQPNAHFRRESSHSVQSDNPGGPNRGNFASQGNRNRGSFNTHNQFNNQMGYPPNNQFRNGPNQNRPMPPAFQPQTRGMQYPNSPQPARSPALVPSMPNTPNMPPATMQSNMTMQTPPQYHYPPPMAPQHGQVQLPFPAQMTKHNSRHHRHNKGRREHDRPTQAGGFLENHSEQSDQDFFRSSRRFSQRSDAFWREPKLNNKRAVSIGNQNPQNFLLSLQPQPPPQYTVLDMSPPESSHIDLSPENGGFERWLTLKNQNFGYPPPQQMDQFGRPIPYAYGAMPYMPPPQTNSPAYNTGFVPPNFHQQSHGMSRTPSQPERPSSASQPSQTVIVSSTQQQPNAQAKPAPNSFVKPKKSAAIQIKNAAGEVIDTSTFKQPSSPAPSGLSTRTPPVTSTPTPPHKPSTPSHSRSDSQPTPKTAKEIQDELKAKIRQATLAATEQPNPEAQATEDVTAEQKEPPKVEVKEEAAEAPKEEPKEETKPETQEQPAVVQEAVQPEKQEIPKVEEPVKPAEAQEDKKADEKPKEPEAAPADEEDEIERMIREMEEAEAKREEQEQAHRQKVEAEKAAAKALEESTRAARLQEEDRKLKEQEREMERLEEEKEKRQKEAEASGTTLSFKEAMAQARSGSAETNDGTPNLDSVSDKLASISIGDKAAGTADNAAQKEKRVPKPAALNLAPINTKSVEPPQPSAALQSLQSARFLQIMDQDIYPAGIKSPNPAVNAAVAKKGKVFKYDANFLLQFQNVFTEQPSLQFHQQIKSLIGDGDRSASRGQTPSSARQTSRGGGFQGGGFGGGPFGGAPGRTLPPGTTSADRMAISSGALPRPSVNPMASFQRPGTAFPGPTPMSRTSSQNMRNMPNSPRQSNRSTRGSRRNDFNAKEAQAAKTMPLTAGQEVKPIAVTSTGWKPTSIGKAPSGQANPDGHLDPEIVQRKVKAALNKMTPEKFEKIADQILIIASQSKEESDGRTLRQVIQLTFEKATDEAHWASMYAKFCKRMLETMSPDIRDERIKDKNGNIVSGGNLFRKYLLNRCQEEFERGWTTDLPEPKESGEGGDSKKPGEAVMLTDEYYAAAAAKRRGLGLVQFIGELYKLEMLTERIMHECVRKLVDYKGVPDEAEIESLCKLLRTIGANLDGTEKGRPMMDAYFARIQSMGEIPELASRMKFMLLDVIDLRKARWVSKEANKGPKTLDEVRADAEAAQAAKAQESAKNNQRGGGGGRPPIGRGDARNFSAGFNQQTSNQVGMDDLRRLKGAVNRSSSGNVTLGPSSMFASRSNSGRRLGPGGSLGRPGEDSNSSSRTGTPGPTSSNAFSLLATMNDGEHPGSPPSAGPSPMMSKAVPASDNKDGE